eukprot:15434564-Alexandrium_andersonii.AAC.1
MHASGASGAAFEDVSGPAQFKLRTPEAILYFRRADCGLRRIAALTSRGRIADCTLGSVPCKDRDVFTQL